MTTPFKIIASSLMLAGMLALSACNTDNEGSTTPKPAAAAPSTTTAPSSSMPSHPSTSPAAAPTAPLATPPTATPTAAADSNDSSKQLHELLTLAKQGKAPGVAYAAHSGLIDDVEKAWGKADKQESAGSGIYATYTKRNVVIGFNKGSQIFDVRSSDPSLQKLTLNQIEMTLGKPADTKINGEDTIYIYKANDQFELKFIIPKSMGKVDHISVFAPQDSINNMAQ